MAWIIFNLLSYMPDMDIHCFGNAEGTVFPSEFDEFIAGEHMLGASGKRVEYVKFNFSDFNGFAIFPYPPLAGVDL